MAVLHGVRLDPKDPNGRSPFLQRPLSRGVADPWQGLEQSLLSPDFVQIQQAFRLGSAQRDGREAVDPLADLSEGEVVLIELDEGGIAITTAAHLRGEGLEQGEKGATSRGVGQDLAGRLFVLRFAEDDLIQHAREELARQLAERFGKKVRETADLSLSWLGTKLLLKAIEARLPVASGLYRWNGGEITSGQRVEANDPQLLQAASKGMVLFIHGTGSCTRGSFGQLATTTNRTWDLLQSHFQGEIYGFEHHTFSESPIENALQLAHSLPQGARLHLVSHSRGGLVADLLCLASLDDGLIEQFRYRGPEKGVLGEQLKDAQANQQQQLRELRSLLAEKAFRVERYVRVASPARGTRLLGSHLDLFLSGLLSLVGMVPGLAGHPVYAVLKRVVLEIVKGRTHPGLVPGLAAMLPDSPFGALLAQAPLRGGLAMATIAGHCEGANPLQKLALLLGDAFFFQRCANDLVVDTAAMQAGIAARAGARTLVERAGGVNHFHYFQRANSCLALGRWLSEPKPDSLSEFHPLESNLADRERTSTRTSDQQESGPAPGKRSSSVGEPQPMLVLVPDLLASHLWRPRQKKRLWFDPADRSASDLTQLSDIHDLEIEAEKVMEVIYGDLCRELLHTHRVERFCYDWRQPLETSSDQLVAVLRELLAHADPAGPPVRLLAHGMGGLVVRGMIARAPELWKQLIQRDGARFVMLGTPNHGTHHTVATLLGRSAWIRQQATPHPALDLQGDLDALAAFPGVMQALPQPGWCEDDTSEPVALEGEDWFDPARWRHLQSSNRDPYFGDGLGATPDQPVLESGRWFWNQGQGHLSAIPGDHPERVILVNGQAPSTPCELTLQDGQPMLFGTRAGDGMVTWRSAAIGGIGATYLMEADHGNLPSRQECFPALVELLQQGSTTLLPEMPGAGSSERHLLPPEPVPWPSEEELLRGLVSGQPPSRGILQPVTTLRVSCHAMDLRFIHCPLMVGHYEQDPIAAAEALMDQSIVGGELSSRERLGVYAGPVGTATVVLMNRGQAELHQGRCRGAVVIGLGKLGELSVPLLTEAVQVGTLRYLLQIVDRHGANQVEAVNVELASLLIGQNSTNAISIDDSVTSLVRGVQDANLQFARAFPNLSVRVGRLRIVEVFLDTAITATRALRTLEKAPRSDGAAPLEVDDGLRLGKGWRHRLNAPQATGYWPRLLVLGAEDQPAADARPSPRLQVSLANQLKYAFLGERARAETIPHTLQGGLVEELVAASIHQPVYNADLSRTLFQLLVPTPFKDLARRLDQLVLVLDESTANLPWELLMADDQPMALQLAVVRQLQSPNYRLRVRQSPSRNALVIGNPLTTGFYNVFAGQPAGAEAGLISLSGASDEATAVSQLLGEHGYDVESSIEDGNGVDVINKLYRRPYRVLHIAGHGVFEQLTLAGERRSGVVLANGMLITVGEIEAMEVVPDVVFLNCCHLGTVKSAITTPFNRLAASVASQLIEMGVRAVVACGWAVNDQAAVAFAKRFHGEMLANKRFGEAVFEARKAAHKASPECNTWGAYQAYGDPAFLLEAPRDSTSRSQAKPQEREVVWVTPHELIDRLHQLLVWAEETTGRHPPSLGLLEGELAALRETAPASWLREAEVALALAETTAALGKTHWEDARTHYLEAIRSHQGDDGLPVRAIEQLVQLEALLGGVHGDRELLNSALRRANALIALMEAKAQENPQTKAEIPSPEQGGSHPSNWFALKGLALKQLAGLLAHQNVEASGSKPSGRASKRARGDEQPFTMAEALQASIESYGLAGADPESRIDRLLLEGVQALSTKKESQSGQAEARGAISSLQEEVQAAFLEDPTFSKGLRAADALLAVTLLDGTLAEQGATGRRTLRLVLEAYRNVFTTCHASPHQRDCALQQLLLVETLLRAQGHSHKGSQEVCEHAADQISHMLKTLQVDAPASEVRNDLAEDEDEGVMVVG